MIWVETPILHNFQCVINTKAISGKPHKLD